MQVNVAKSAGFCFGVKRALDIAFKTAATVPDVYILGDIVHNEEVIRELESAGIKKIKRLASSKNKTLLIRAHGVSKKLLERTQKLGYKIIDATCPMVKEIHKIAKTIEDEGYSVIIIGDKNHDEVRGIIGQLKTKGIVIENPGGIPIHRISRIKKAGVVVQSTQNIENVLKILKVLRQHIKKVEFFNTVCRPTRVKQEEIKKMPLENGLMLVIGSKTSANTGRLYEISKSLNPKTYWVQSRKDLKKEWFKNVKTLGLTAGASTPDRTINEIIACLSSLTP